MKRIALILIALLCTICLWGCSEDESQKAGSTNTDADFSDKGEIIPGEHINVHIPENNGFDIYKVPRGIDAGYRYGPSFIVYEDGSIDAWFASGGSSLEQWDWIVYKHYDGEFWSEEKCVLQPTPNALDHYSCCDPGVIYLNGYYYLAYTSTLNENQADNNLFVARSEKPDGPYEKWNGNGWGGYDPQPIVAFTEDQSLWGIGEASFVELDGKLYIYYTCNGASGHNTLLATADATSENWPATMEYQGVVLRNSSCDAIDVKYVDKYERFLAIASDNRLTEDSYLTFFESKDGIDFIEVDALKKNVYEFCHNPGMSGSENGHIIEGRKSFVAYAYGPQWGVWNTRFQEIEISLAQNANTLEKDANNLKVKDMARDSRNTYSLDFVGISPQAQCALYVPSSQKQVVLNLNACTIFHDRWTDLNLYKDEVKLYGYDTSILEQMDTALRFKVLGIGETMVTAEFRGHLTYIYINVYNDSAKGELAALEPLFSNTLDIDRSINVNHQPQIKSKAIYDNGKWEMIWAAELYDISFDYDEAAMTIDQNGRIEPKKEGTYTVTVNCENRSYDLTVNITFPKLDTLYFSGKGLAYDMICETNNTRIYTTKDNVLRCLTTEASDPYINFDLSRACVDSAEISSFTITYMIPESNTSDSFDAQVFFRCEGGSYLEDSSQRASLIRDGKYHKLTLKLKNKSYWKGNVANIRIDYFDTCDVNEEFFIKSISFDK